MPLAAGENHYTRFEFNRVIEDGAITILQPDLSKTGGITEILRIAAMASAYKLPIHPHTSMTGLNMAATHPFPRRDRQRRLLRGRRVEEQPVPRRAHELALRGRQGRQRAAAGAPGIGVEVNEDFLGAHPPIEGRAMFKIRRSPRNGLNRRHDHAETLRYLADLAVWRPLAR